MTKRKLMHYGVILVLLLNFIFLAACNSKDAERKEKEEKLANTVYTYDTLIDDIKKYFSKESDTKNDWYWYYAPAQYSQYIDNLKNNDSVQSLLDKTLSLKLKDAKIHWRIMFILCYAHQDSWPDNKNLVVYDEISECFMPLLVFEMQIFEPREQDEMEASVAKCIKNKLRDPESLQIEESWEIFVQYKEGNKSYYVSESGHYTGGVLLHVPYRAKNGFGGYNASSAWIRYYNAGFVLWMSETGENAYTQYGANKNIQYLDSYSLSKRAKN